MFDIYTYVKFILIRMYVATCIVLYCLYWFVCMLLHVLYFIFPNVWKFTHSMTIIM